MTSFETRDAFILHQEHIQRMNEGDEVDTSADQKVVIELQRITDTESTVKVTFSHEDHTLGNALRHILMQSPEVITAGYAIPHPLESKMLLHVQSTDYAIDSVVAGLEQLAQFCDKTSLSLEKALENHERAELLTQELPKR